MQRVERQSGCFWKPNPAGNLVVFSGTSMSEGPPSRLAATMSKIVRGEVSRRRNKNFTQSSQDRHCNVNRLRHSARSMMDNRPNDSTNFNDAGPRSESECVKTNYSGRPFPEAFPNTDEALHSPLHHPEMLINGLYVQKPTELQFRQFVTHFPLTSCRDSVTFTTISLGLEIRFKKISMELSGAAGFSMGGGFATVQLFESGNPQCEAGVYRIKTPKNLDNDQ
jgi:hypothetical protein